MAWGADYKDAMLGWTDSHGVFHHGALWYEGCSPKNPLGKQDLKHDPGNFINGKPCGVKGARTLAGISCRSNPTFPFATATIDDVLKYYESRWKLIHGDEIRAPYLAFKLMRLSIIMGDVGKKNPAIVLLEQTINDLNGSAKDFSTSDGLTPDEIQWLNEFTAPEKLADGTESNWRRWAFYERYKALALMRYGKIISRNPKLAEFWDNWSGQAEYDR